MIQVIIGENEAGQRFDKYLGKLLSKAPAGFYYKMLRKKNITLNDKKASGKEKLAKGDHVKLFLAEETFEKFSNAKNIFKDAGKNHTALSALKLPKDLHILYEDEQILLWNKPVHMLSQKAKETDISLNEYFLAYLLNSGQIRQEELNTFKPSICNRLDRNTSGIVICGKTLAGLQKMNELIKTRELKKYYICIVKGELKEPLSLKGYLLKDEAVNKVSLSSTFMEGFGEIATEIIPLEVFELLLDEKNSQLCTLAKVHLITGKTHQIRAHLSSIGHPILGDYKYGNRKLNDRIKEKYKITDQLLHAYCLVFPKLEEPFLKLSERTFRTEFPERFKKLHGFKSQYEQ